MNHLISAVLPSILPDVMLACRRQWLTVIQVQSHICNHFQTSFDLELVAMSVFALKLLMIVSMKALTLLYNIDTSTIHKV